MIRAHSREEAEAKAYVVFDIEQVARQEAQVRDPRKRTRRCQGRTWHRRECGSRCPFFGSSRSDQCMVERTTLRIGWDRPLSDLDQCFD